MEIIEDYFDLIENDAGEFMLSLEPRDATPDNPRVIYAGNSSAVLFRRPDEVIHLVCIPGQMQDHFHSIESLLVVEMTETGELAHTYDAPMIRVQAEQMPKLPAKPHPDAEPQVDIKP